MGRGREIALKILGGTLADYDIEVKDYLMFCRALGTALYELSREIENLLGDDKKEAICIYNAIEAAQGLCRLTEEEFGLYSKEYFVSRSKAIPLD